MHKKEFSRIEMNIIISIIGASILIPNCMMFFLGNSSEMIQKVSIFVLAIGFIFLILQCIIKVEKNDERSFENASKAGALTALVMQTVLNFTAAVFVIFKNYMRSHSSSLVIFMMLGLLIMVRSLAFIKFEKAGE